MKKQQEEKTSRYNAYIEMDVLEKLKKEAKYKKININSFVNKMLRDSLFDKKKGKKVDDIRNKILICPECDYQGKMLTRKSNHKRVVEKKKNLLQRIFGS